MTKFKTGQEATMVVQIVRVRGERVTIEFPYKGGHRATVPAAALEAYEEPEEEPGPEAQD